MEAEEEVDKQRSNNSMSPYSRYSDVLVTYIAYNAPTAVRLPNNS